MSAPASATRDTTLTVRLVERGGEPRTGDGSSLLVSVLTPVRNEQSHLTAMLESLLAQTHEHWELLAVDDGSTDDTACVLERYARRDARIQVVSARERLGKVGAFNAAHAAARGDVVCHVGGDDLLPVDSLAHRAHVLAPYVHRRAVAFFKLSLFTTVPGDRATIVPRGRRGSMSGPSITMTKALADLVMPIPAELVSEDIWMGNAADALADVRLDSPRAVIDYRMHAGNSNPRSKSFETMTSAIHARMRAYEHLLTTDRFELPAKHRARARAELEAEAARHAGDLIGVWRADVPVVDRLALSSMAHPALWAVRSALLTPLTGWRGR